MAQNNEERKRKLAPAARRLAKELGVELDQIDVGDENKVLQVSDILTAKREQAYFNAMKKAMQESSVLERDTANEYEQPKALIDTAASETRQEAEMNEEIFSGLSDSYTDSEQSEMINGDESDEGDQGEISERDFQTLDQPDDTQNDVFAGDGDEEYKDDEVFSVDSDIDVDPHTAHENDYEIFEYEAPDDKKQAEGIAEPIEPAPALKAGKTISAAIAFDASPARNYIAFHNIGFERGMRRLAYMAALKAYGDIGGDKTVNAGVVAFGETCFEKYRVSSEEKNIVDVKFEKDSAQDSDNEFDIVIWDMLESGFERVRITGLENINLFLYGDCDEVTIEAVFKNSIFDEYESLKFVKMLKEYMINPYRLQ